MSLTDSHSFRQADGYGIARNFLEEDANILYPRVDKRGNLSGVSGGEFPILNYITYLTYLITGVQWFNVRLINLIVSSLGIYVFYRLIRDYYNPKSAFPAAIILLVSIWLVFSRKFMPDTFSASLVISGIYFVWKYVHQLNKLHLFFAVSLVSIGLLSKISSFVILAFAAPLLIEKIYNFRTKLTIVFAFIVSIIPVIWWYFVWVPELNAKSGLVNFFLGRSISESIPQITEQFGSALQRFYQDAFYFLAFGLFVLGSFLMIRCKSSRQIILFISSVLLILVYVGVTGMSFTEHDYYIIPIVPFMTFISARGIEWFNSTKVRAVLLFSIVIECGLNQMHQFLPDLEEELRITEMQMLVNEHTKKHDLFIVNGNNSPKLLYLADRKGWSLFSEKITQQKLIESKTEEIDYLLWNKSEDTFNLPINKSLLFETSHWVLVPISD